MNDTPYCERITPGNMDLAHSTATPTAKQQSIVSYIRGFSKHDMWV